MLRVYAAWRSVSASSGGNASFSAICSGDQRPVTQRHHQRDLLLLRHELDVRQHGRGHLEDTSEVFE